MSLDVSLYGTDIRWCVCTCGHEHETNPPLFTANITHNLVTMARAADVYDACWRPEVLNITTAQQLLPYLREGLEALIADPAGFTQYNPSNGYGSYTDFVVWLEDYAAACARWPAACVRVRK